LHAARAQPLEHTQCPFALTERVEGDDDILRLLQVGGWPFAEQALEPLACVVATL